MLEILGEDNVYIKKIVKYILYIIFFDLFSISLLSELFSLELEHFWFLLTDYDCTLRG